MVKGIHHIAIRAENMENTLKFYTEVLDFSIRKEWSLPQFNLKHAAMLKSADGNTFIEVFDKDADIAAQGKKRSGNEEIVQGALLHLAFTVDNATEMYEKAISQGAKPFIEPSVLEIGNNPSIRVKNSLVYSPNGEVIEFIEENEF